MQRLTKLSLGMVSIGIMFFLTVAPYPTAAVDRPGEVQITSCSTNFDPALYEDMVVWITKINGTYGVYGLNLETGRSFFNTADPCRKKNPQIYQDVVVWEDMRNGNWDIYGYDLATYQEFQITKDEKDQTHPAIYGDIVVWEDRRNGESDIYGYNLKTHEEFLISKSEGSHYTPDIFEDLVVWHGYRNSGNAIYGYDLLTGQEFQIVDVTWSFDLVLSGKYVVWQDYDSGNQEIYAYNLSSSERTTVFRDLWRWEWSCRSDPMTLRKIAAYDDTVLWASYRDCNYDIYGYNLATGNQVQITSDLHDQFFPALYKNTAVWMDDRDGNYNVYGYDLDFPVVPVWLTYEKKVTLLRLSYAAFLVFFAIGAGIIGRKVKPLQNLSEKPVQVLKRGPVSVVAPAVVSLMFAAFSLYFFESLVLYEANFSIIVTILSFALISLLPVYITDWCARTPYILMTDTGVTVLGVWGNVQRVKWNDIQEVSVQKKKIDIFTEKREIIVWLSVLSEKEKEQFVRRIKDLSESADIPLHEET
ncbi:MAG: hypothetical protein HXS52_12915 [Theionarchaea archaeon]|nr:hypothetical protein [Theionarchaea archaeon]MBU7038826.1 hypothetical protein [Theionarchaea archaeon]